MDGFDPSIAPGPRTPSPGGFLYYEVVEILQGLAKQGDIVGVDLVEVAPDYDHSGITAFFAARVLLDILGYVFHERSQRTRAREARRSRSDEEIPMTARFRVHIENETKLMPVFTVYPNQYEAALGRHAEVAKFVDTTWGIDGDVFERAIADTDALIGYRFPRAQLAERAPKLKFVQVLGAGVDYMLPFDWVPRGINADQLTVALMCQRRLNRG